MLAFLFLFTVPIFCCHGWTGSDMPHNGRLKVVLELEVGLSTRLEGVILHGAGVVLWVAHSVGFSATCAVRVSVVGGGGKKGGDIRLIQTKVSMSRAIKELHQAT